MQRLLLIKVSDHVSHPENFTVYKYVPELKKKFQGSENLHVIDHS